MIFPVGEQDQLDQLLVTFQRLETEMNRKFGEREDLVRTCLLALLANEHVYLIGPPGTAKSLIVRTLAGFLPEISHYETLLHGGSRLEDLLCSTLSGASLIKSQMVFLDEVFRAPKDLLLGLLSFMNERCLYFPDGRHAALLSLFGASNQSPSPADGLDAFYDRFTYRCLLRPIDSRERFFQMVFQTEEPETDGKWTGQVAVSADFLSRIPSLSRKRLSWGSESQDALFELRRSLGKEGVFVSDRRWKKVVLATTVNALYAGDTGVSPKHLSGLKNVLWSYPPEIRPIERILSTYR